MNASKTTLLCAVWLCLILCVRTDAANLDVAVSATRGTLEGQIGVSWDPIRFATGYFIYRSANYDGPYVMHDKVCGETRYTDDSADSGVYYWYRVTPLYWIFQGGATRRVQGWVRPSMAGGMVDTMERIPKILKQVPHFYTVRDLAERRRNTLPVPDIRDLSIPGNDRIFGWVKGVCATEHRRIGSPESLSAVRYIKKILGSMPGMDVRHDAFPLDAVYRADTWRVEVETSKGAVVIDAFYAVNTGMTLDKPTGGSISGEMVWAGAGSPEEFDAIGDISGKVVVADCEFPDLPIGLLAFLFGEGYAMSDPENWLGFFQSVTMTFARSNFPPEYEEERYPDSVYWQAADRGAAGLVLIMKNHPGDTNTHWGPYDGRMRSMPCFWVSSYLEDEMKDLAEQGFAANLTLTGQVGPGEGHNIYGILKGRSPEIILVSSHHDSCHKGATEDGTGIAMVLAQADIWSRIPCHLREKTLVFVLTDGHHYRGIGGRMFADTHARDIMDKVIIDINLEHLAARDAVDDGYGSLVTTGRGALTLIFVNESPTAIATAARMLENMVPAPDRTLEIHSTLIGDVPPGEAGHYHIAAGIDFIHWIGSPPYLLTAEDTLDKVDENLLNPIARSVTEMVATYMMIPEGYRDYE